MTTVNIQTVGYIRVSTVEQNVARQLHDIPCDKLFTDTVSGSTIERPALSKMIEYVREGDTILVHSMDRLARNTADLLRLVKQFTDNKITIRFIKENLTFDGSDNPLGQLMLTMLGAIAQFELSLMQARQREGIERAKARGVYKRAKKLTDEHIEIIKEKVKLGVPKALIAREIGITSRTIWNYLNQRS